MEEVLEILKKVILGLVGGGAALLAFYLALFFSIMVLVPTSSPNQLEEWTNTVVTVFGIKMTLLWMQRLKGAAIGMGIVLPLAAIAWFSLRTLIKQQ
ncbi:MULTISPECIES: hypothetical protein [unclassified Coleofasciculus]|uniref:hypothetical protein n=1 Tax=Cyanophyceae TaxID=3028117 RepID=UPI0016896AF5|nr:MULTISPECIES: hypothetical protein [unclassified Coleofasciculus]MBD1836774.1 hypothetical protein [Coleofasciculus sp. FACHB-501]MBD2083484.1 hypothetical protein [Coleofasciculus sp. FACHB-542]MBD2541888.1 hypothetical protein [Coleofasciculus sp. FACHB-SPT36]